MSARPSVLFLNQHYWPDVASTGQHLTDLAEHLAGVGFEVRVLTGRAGYLGGELDVPEREVQNGVQICRMRLPGFRRGRESQAGRAVDYAAFHLRSALAALLEGEPPDLVVSLTTPSLLPATVRAICTARQVPYAVWAMDLHPELEEELGLLPGPPAVPLRAAGRWGYREAEFVVALGPHMARRIQECKGVPGNRIREIPVWSDAQEVRPVPRKDNPLRRELGLDGAFVVMYSGNAGLAHCFDEVCEAMARLDGEDGVEFVFVGGGPRAGEIRRFVWERGIRSFRYLDYFPRNRLHESLSLADVHLITLRREMAGLAAPGKLQGILAAGRPAVMVGPKASEPGKVLAETGVGTVIEPDGDPRRGGRTVAGALLRLQADPDRRRELGRRARDVFLERFERTACCHRWEALLRDHFAPAGLATGRASHRLGGRPRGPSAVSR